MNNVRSSLCGVTALLATTGIGACPPVEDAETMSGLIVCEDFVLPEGKRIVADGDLHIICFGDACIGGVIVGVDGASIEIEARSVCVRGAIQGGTGRTSTKVREVGGMGGDVTLRAQSVMFVDGTAKAGAGGQGGPSGIGGNGGTLTVFGSVGGGHFVGSSGGPGGHGIAGYASEDMNGGDGGWGGDVIILPRQRPSMTAAR